MSEKGEWFFCGIDLAERHSALVTVNSVGDVVYEATLDTGPKENVPNPFIKAERLFKMFDAFLEFLEGSGIDLDNVVFAVEDIAPHMMDPKPALKLQGALLARLVLLGKEAHIMTAQVWQRDYGYVSKKQSGDTKKWATALCEEMGYVPGSSLPAGTKILAKAKTDLRDGFLIAQWLRNLCLNP